MPGARPRLRASRAWPKSRWTTSFRRPQERNSADLLKRDRMGAGEGRGGTHGTDPDYLGHFAALRRRLGLLAALSIFHCLSIICIPVSGESLARVPLITCIRLTRGKKHTHG